jgi:hypothetical protein
VRNVELSWYDLKLTSGGVVAFEQMRSPPEIREIDELGRELANC